MPQLELSIRTRRFALRVLQLVKALTASHPGHALAQPLADSGVSVGSCYRAACRARTRAEFAACLEAVAAGAAECACWMALVIDAALLPPRRVLPLLAEATALRALASAS